MELLISYGLLLEESEYLFLGVDIEVVGPEAFGQDS